MNLKSIYILCLTAIFGIYECVYSQNIGFETNCTVDQNGTIKEAFKNNCVTNWSWADGAPALVQNINKKFVAQLVDNDAIRYEQYFDSCNFYYLKIAFTPNFNSGAISTNKLSLVFKKKNAANITQEFIQPLDSSINGKEVSLNLDEISLKYSFDELVLRFESTVSSNNLVVAGMELATTCERNKILSTPLVGIGNVKSDNSLTVNSPLLGNNSNYTLSGSEYVDLESGFYADDGNELQVEVAICNYPVLPCGRIGENVPTHVYNFFSPNGDGINEFFFVENIALYTNSKVRIFNQFGQEVYNKTNYMNDWDAPNLPGGLYHYQIKLRANDPILKGELLIEK